MTVRELAWAAGFFDGEGNVHAHEVGSNWYATARIEQIETTVLRRFQKAVGVGRINGPYTSHMKRFKNARPIYHYGAHGEDVRTIHTLLAEYLSGPKRRQFKQVLAISDRSRRMVAKRIRIIRSEAVRKAWIKRRGA